ncbi:MAG: acetyl-CoA C-acetyltransferase [Acidobacteriota bacterium]
MGKGSDVVIIGCARTPIGRFGGVFRSLRAYRLAGIAMAEAMNRAGIEPGQLSDVILGDCLQCADEANTARTAALGIGIPMEVPGVTIQRGCASGMQAVIFAAQQLQSGDSEIVLAGGVESMSSAPYVLPAVRWGARLQHNVMMDPVWEVLHAGSNLLERGNGYIMGRTAENLAQKYNIQREEQDLIALRSHNNAELATKAGLFKEEITPVEVSGTKGRPEVVDKDEHIRFGLKMEALSSLKPAFRPDGTVTAGNSSGLNDGAAALVLTNRARAKDLGVPPLARIVAKSVAGVDPRFMGYGPVPATQKVLKMAGLDLRQIELIELNEAFAAQYLACEKGLGLNREITNVNGSGIALGHPVGATGARILISLIYEMKRRSVTLGLATLCVGGGMGAAVILENE